MFNEITSTIDVTNITECNSSSNSTVTVYNIVELCQDLVLNTSSCMNATTNSTTGTEDLDRSCAYWLIGKIICVFGIVCNIFNLTVLTQKELRDSPYMYLTTLAVSDLSFLSVSLIHLLLSHASASTFKAVFDAFIFFPIGNTFFNSSVWVIVTLSIERTSLVLAPLSVRPTRKKAKIRSLLIVFVCVLVNIPRYLVFRLHDCDGVTRLATTDFQSSKAYYKLSWFYAIFSNFTPLVILICTNCVLMYALHAAQKDRSWLGSNQDVQARRDQMRLNRTCVAIIVLFLLCVIPSAFVEDPIAYSLFGGDKTFQEYLRSPENQTFIYISNDLLFFNSSMNFFLYCAFSLKFRRGMRRLYKKTYTTVQSWSSKSLATSTQNNKVQTT